MRAYSMLNETYYLFSTMKPHLSRIIYLFASYQLCIPAKEEGSGRSRSIGACGLMTMMMRLPVD